MTGVELLLVVSVAVMAAGIAGLFRPPSRRLAPRIRPYTIAARVALGAEVDPFTLGSVDRGGVGTTMLGRLFVPPLLALSRRIGAMVESRSDDVLALRLHHAGYSSLTPDQYRMRQLAQTAAFAVLGLTVGFGVLHAPAVGLALGLCGATIGATRWRGRIETAIVARCERMRAELYTVNQILALHVRTGAGPVQATQRLVGRARGAVIDELAEVLVWIRNGSSEGEAFRRAAELTPEPAAARTYRLFAVGAERGTELAGALLQLSADIRDSRREDLRKSATRRRAAMLVPTIAVLAPIMILFIAAPIPSIVFGSR